MKNETITNENTKMGILEFAMARCAGIKKPYFNGRAVEVQRVEYIPGEDVGMVYFMFEDRRSCQYAKTNEFEVY